MQRQTIQKRLINQVMKHEQVHFKYLFIILSLFGATWLVSNIVAIKFVYVFGITLTGGFIVFPFNTLLGSLLVEVYGYKNARQAIWAGLVLNLTFVFFVYLVYLIPGASEWRLDREFKSILLPDIRVISASIISLMVAEFVNTYLMAKMKLRSRNDSLAIRIFVSCGCSFLLDLVLFLSLAFYGTIPNNALLHLIEFAYLKKIICQVTLFPLICYLIVNLKKAEGVDIYDFDTKFNPFSLDNIYVLKEEITNSDKRYVNTPIALHQY